MRTLKTTLKIVGIAVAAVLLVVIAYLLYVIFSYSRIGDVASLEINGAASSSQAQVGREYSVVTQNVGFGAYTPQFTFFMDGGKQSRASSADSVRQCVGAAADKVRSFNPDFAFFQEVDTDSDRSYHIDQRNIIAERFGGFSSSFAYNYRSAYLFFPITKPHGASNSGIMTYSAITPTLSSRKSLPVSNGFGKFLDLDRCFTVMRVPVENGKELVLYNVHLSAYGMSEQVRSAQMNLLLSDMQNEYEKGNYCVAGGDFNHDFTGDSTFRLNGQNGVSFGWAQPFPEDILAKYGAIERAMSYDGEVTPTCRNCDVVYDENTFTIIVDGFLVSKNITVNGVENVMTHFEYSDHNPVVMKFILN